MLGKKMSGKLKAGVFGASVAWPVPNATVSLFEQNQDGEAGNIIDEFTTDSSGICRETALSCPARGYSLSAGSEKPYSEYIVRASAYGFEQVEVKGVQVFEETLAILNINLPYRSGSGNEEETIRIGEHCLWQDCPDKIPEPELKELPKETGLVVLEQPVIPEYIIVHDGDPNYTGAPDYYVPFADYIKNVCSSEIYPTWPDETIKANVLAIISFTLNRVYTEWYRGKGKKFTVTSSTQYDQAYVHRRNIFESISRVVDEIFTTYITKPGIRQPLFAQYCDGRRSQCSGWMTQWGSLRLGEQGYDALGILRHFYGSDVYLTQAKKVAGIPVSYPGHLLETGSRGNQVTVIQRELNRISNNFPMISKVKDDGIFGEETAASVRQFQRIFNLKPDGIVGFATWYRLSDVYVSVSRMTELL
jgi:peptidoglycan hydrolase-like protein with peptidoglycan-binding domain